MSVQGNDDSGLGFGVEGTSTNGIGVVGRSDQGPGVRGESGTADGVLGVSDSAPGVSGASHTGPGLSGSSDEGNGVLGVAIAPSASGVFGSHQGTGNGITGVSTGGLAVFGEAGGEVDPDHPVAGVMGVCLGNGWGVVGISGQRHGVTGTTHDGLSAGIYGRNEADGDGVFGEGRMGVHGIAITNDMFGAGVLGESNVTSAAGVKGIAPDGFGVVGLSGAGIAAGTAAGVFGGSSRGPGVYGMGIEQPGVFATGSPAILALGDIGAGGAITGFSGNFVGDVSVLGILRAPNKTFEIDHPLDPANKYLRHACVESPEMKTVYDGMVMLDENGAASIELPDWFEALNTTFRYQLTPIGAPGPELYIAREIADSQFMIAGGPPGLQVCWQVTGVRQDRSAQARPLRVEEDKPTEERGTFLDPEAHGQPPELSVARIRNPRLFQQPSS